MRIVIDMQGGQTESRFRGIGRYTLSFAQAIVRNRGEHEVYLALSGLFPESIEPIRAAFEGLLPEENIRVWYAPGPVQESEPENKWRREIAELIREAFLASLQPDVIHISSLFEGYVDDAVTSIGRFDEKTPVTISLYDLIPLLNPKHYLDPTPAYSDYYKRKIIFLNKAHAYLAISEFSQQEGVTNLQRPASSFVNVSTAIEPQFQPVQIDQQNAKNLLDKFNINRAFLLYTGGDDQRKNLPRLIQAYADLPAHLRAEHQLLFAGKMPEENISEFKHLAQSAGLKQDALCFTGYITDKELVQLYNLCKLFVFPSWHEGFGLPALEAMACGAPVIGANTSSLPKLIGLDAALFDPLNVMAICQKMTSALENDDFRASLRQHGLQQAKKFSWDQTAKYALAKWQQLEKLQTPQNSTNQSTGRKLRLAFVSPLPPERTGIADYSAALLLALAMHYDLEIIVEQKQVDTPWVIDHPAKVHDAAWLRSHANEIDRVIYQMGNSPFHAFMLPLLREIPGTVVLHDFYLSGLISWLEIIAGASNAWVEALYAAHGYVAVRQRFLDSAATAMQYPVNLQLIQHAQGLIVHSEYSRTLGQQWYGSKLARGFEVVPLVRVPTEATDKAAARKHLGISEDTFLVCSFGFLEHTKFNHRLLNSWLKSSLACNKQCQLVFVGENDGAEYGLELLKTIKESEVQDRIRITGFASPETFYQYLAAADLAVQLRANSRGETSAAVLDCMNYGLPLIVNANGSMAELDRDAVCMLVDDFEDVALIEALETLWREPEKRRDLGARARKVIQTHHTPAHCAQLYVDAIEQFHDHAVSNTQALVSAIVLQQSIAPESGLLMQLAKNIATTLPIKPPAKRLFLDVTTTCRTDLKTGIERVARALLIALLESPPVGYRIEPVYLTVAGGEWHYRFACRYTLGILGCPSDVLADEIVEPEHGDILLGLDLSGSYTLRADVAGLFLDYRNKGVKIYQVVYDLLPVTMPEVFPTEADRHHAQWLQVISKFDGAICISKAVADDLAVWQKEVGISWQGRRPFQISWFHLGADVANSAPSAGLPKNAEQTLSQIKARPSFLMVGTLEPRKGYLQAIEAFSQLWSEGVDVNLVIVGKEGWQGLPENTRRNIPETISTLRSHPELNKCLFWLEGISDEYLEKIYAASTCLIAASEGEGFGLPLIEAAQHKLSIIARNIPVFREVAGDHAYFFSGTTPDDLANAIKLWISLYSKDEHPKSKGIQYLTWHESASKLKKIIELTD